MQIFKQFYKNLTRKTFISGLHLVQVQQLRTATSNDLNILHQFGKMVQTKSQKSGKLLSTFVELTGKN